MKLLGKVRASRRGFFGLSAGGVLTAKSAVNEVANEAVLRSKYTSAGRFTSEAFGIGANPSSEHDDWKSKTIARLRAIVAGKPTPEQVSEWRLERLALARSTVQVEVLNLRSISDAAKMRLLNRRNVEVSRRVEREEARKRLLYDFGVPAFLVEGDDDQS